MNYEDLIENLSQHYTSGKYAEEVKEAKAEFSEWAGAFDDISSDSETKMAQFMDWYLYTRPLSQVNAPPVEWALEDEEFYIPDDLKLYYVNLKNTRHSLFEFLKIKDQDLYIRDLFSGYKHVLKQSPMDVGFRREEIFEARLIPHQDSFIFANSFCFHPPQAVRFIMKEVKQLKKKGHPESQEEREKLMKRLLKMRYKYEQYQHVDVKEIYSNKSKLRI